MKTKNYCNLTVIVPAYNEENGLKESIPSLISGVPGAEVIVVNDGSTDQTKDVIKEFPNVQYVQHSFNQGQGASLRTGMMLASREWVAWFDADNEHRVEDLQQIYELAQSQNLVAVIGQRSTPSASITRALGKWVIRLIGKSLKIKAGTDLNCGLRIFRKKVITNYLQLIPNRFSSSLVTTLIILERGFPMKFHPVKTNARVGNSTVRLKDGFEAILQLIRSVLLFAPMRFFLPTGMIIFMLGVCYSLFIAYNFHNGLPVAGMFAMLSGLLVVALGLVADQISQIRLTGLASRHPYIDEDE
ncbi:glycosyltransferase family 2 protein [Desulfovibrio mangrovi]|uniref:glycosyltransferase family 2 protein n=1 Tax=Desulfovibrio mangrovi TaxID=2976983 RepID=UPI0022466E57|nr:glycosyltransferase family 2 protein [Desulfovibrio mangrovi]UZP65855.1 glycosyltransferase family 2 protein [Desulfovibrio mangrovi]